jgi:hypothetical protein
MTDAFRFISKYAANRSVAKKRNSGTHRALLHYGPVTTRPETENTERKNFHVVFELYRRGTPYGSVHICLSVITFTMTFESQCYNDLGYQCYT